MENPQRPDVPTASYVPPQKEETRVGPYKLLQQIGEGGMGVVYMAEQEHPVRRRVALKIIKPGMDSAHVLARFQAEQQALALMDHQNIAKVYDAGVTNQGRPYFVMELVHGVPITKYCDDNKLTPRERLELFIPVCRAVQHAHQKGIIHRDLKPSNVLVCLYDGKPVAKVIDFGVAKAMEQPLTDATMFTQFGQVIGTLEYMSPEQAEMSQLGIDTRSDIYSLGVMMYELLTGSTPLQRHRVKQAAFDEILKLIREEEPPSPSSRLSKSTETLPRISEQRRMDPAQLTRLLRGELDWIVMKSLEKDRTRRYDSASAFAQDVERYLADEPVEACPPSRTYLLRKYAHKHRTLLTTVAAFTLILLTGTGVSVWQAIRAIHAEGVAQKATDGAIKDRDDAIDAQKKATKATNDLATASEKLRRVLYASDMNLVNVAWNEGRPKRALDLLERHRPKADETDLRGFEWHYWRRRLNSETSRTELEGYADWKRTPGVGEMISYNLTMSPQARFAANAQPEKGGAMLKVWDLATGKGILTTRVPEPRPGSKHVNPFEVLFNPDESQIIVHSVVMANDGTDIPRGFWQFLDRTSGKLLYTLENDLAIFWLPDRKRLLTWHDSTREKTRRMLVRDAATGKILEVLAENVVTCVVDRSRDRCALLIQEKQGQPSLVRIHDTATGKKISEIPMPAAFQPGVGWFDLSFVDDEDTLVIRLEQGDSKEKEKSKDWPASFHAVTGWEVATGKFRWSWEPEQRYGIPHHVFPIPNQTLLMLKTAVLGESQHQATLLDAKTGSVVSRFVIQARQEQGYSGLSNTRTNTAWTAPFSHDGTRLIVDDPERATIKVYSLLGLPQPVFFSKSPYSIVATCFSADDRELIALDLHEGVVRRWDTRHWPRFDPKSLPLAPPYCIVEPSGRVCFSHESSLGTTTIQVIDFRNGTPMMKLGPYQGSRVVAAATDELVAVNCEHPAEGNFQDKVRVMKRDIRLIHLPTMRETVLWKGELKTEKLGAIWFGWETVAPSVKLLPRQQRAILWHTDKVAIQSHSRAEMIDLRDGRPIPSWLDDWSTGHARLLMPDGKSLVLTSFPKGSKEGDLSDLMCTDVLTGKIQWKTPMDSFVTDVVADRDGQRLLVNLIDSLHILDAKTGRRLVSLDTVGGNNLFQHLQFSPDGTRVLGAAFTNIKQSLRLWDAASGSSLGVLSGHDDVANRFSASGQQLVGLLPAHAVHNRLVVIDATPLPGDEPIATNKQLDAPAAQDR